MSRFCAGTRIKGGSKIGGSLDGVFFKRLGRLEGRLPTAGRFCEEMAKSSRYILDCEMYLPSYDGK